MCGRVGFIPPVNFKERYEFENDWEGYSARYNVSPGSRYPVITRNSPNKVEMMRWGLIPSWAKDPRIGFRMINARTETVETSGAFRKPFKSQRCLVPISFFYEWQKVEKEKKPYLIKLKGEEVFSLAGLWESWKDVEGYELKSFTILTTAPNSFMKPIHDRMPVILSKDEENNWLDRDQETSKLKTLLDPFPSEKMEAYIVSDEVNKSSNEGKELIENLGDYNYPSQNNT